jgi:hypothetical protein
MKIELKKIKIGEVVKNYVDNLEGGVVGYGGRLNIRPKYQREFVYDEKKRGAVINCLHGKFSKFRSENAIIKFYTKTHHQFYENSRFKN